MWLKSDDRKWLNSKRPLTLWDERLSSWRWIDPDAKMHMSIPEDLYWGSFRSYKDTEYGTENDLPLCGSNGFPNPSKAAPFASILDHKIFFATNGAKDIDGLFKILFARNGGYWFNPEYRVDADELLDAINTFTGHSFTEYFQKYVYGLNLIPYEPYYHYEKALIAIKEGEIVLAKNYLNAAYEKAVQLGENDLERECKRRQNILNGFFPPSIYQLLLSH